MFDKVGNYILNYLASNFTIPSFVTKSLVQLVCRVTKLCWNDDEAHRQFVSEVTKFFQHSPQHMILGMQILNELVVEMNTIGPGQSVTAMRKIATSFRDVSLLTIFQLSLNTILQINLNQFNFSSEVDRNILKLSALNAVLQCLNFDYIGTNPDESSDESGTIQVPGSWRSHFEDFTSLRMFFDLVLQGKSDEAPLAMQILVQYASVRRSLFATDEKRTQYLAQVIGGTVELLERGTVLMDPNTYLHFCRLLSRLKANYQLSELVKMDVYPKWINLVAKFTMDSFKNFDWAENGLYFLLGLWARLTVSIPFMKGDVPTSLQNLVPKIFRSFVSVRLEAVGKLMLEDNLDELFGDVNLDEQGRHLPTLARLSYGEAVEFIKSVFDPIYLSYEQTTQTLSPQSNLKGLMLIEAQLAFLVFVIASLNAAQPMPGTNPDEQESWDADLIARVFQLVKVVDFRQINQAHAPVFPYLDQAIIRFFQEFRRLHVATFDTSTSRAIAMHGAIMDTTDLLFDENGEMTGRKNDLKDAPIYTLLGRYLGQIDQLGILNVILAKIIQNLKYYGLQSSFQHASGNLLVRESLGLLSDLSFGYNSSKMMLLMDSVKTIITNHGPANFPFIMVESNFKCRTTFYLTLGRLVFADSNIDLFDAFMEPFEQAIQYITQNDPHSDISRLLFMGLCRDLRGVLMAAANKKTYNMIFDWIFPKHMPVFHLMLSTYWEKATVVIPFLRFWNEITYNKSQRIIFDAISPNGLLLFKESSKFLQEFGEPLLNACVQNPIEEMFSSESSLSVYKTRYKTMSLSMILLQRLLSGGYVPLGVFYLYDDKSLHVAIDLVIKMMVHMRSIYEAYPKITKSFHSLLEVLFRNHSGMLVELDSTIFNFLIGTLHDGLNSVDSSHSTLVATSLDHIFSWTFKLSKKRDQNLAYQMIGKHFAEIRSLLQVIMNTLFNLVVFEQATHHWALARPIFSLMLIDESFFATYKQQLSSTQSPEVQGRLAQSFAELMEGVQPSLEAKNREKFSQNLSLFRSNAIKFLIRPNL